MQRAVPDHVSGWLLDLALAAGGRDEFPVSCLRFVEALMRLEGVDGASIWWREGLSPQLSRWAGLGGGPAHLSTEDTPWRETRAGAVWVTAEPGANSDPGFAWFPVGLNGLLVVSARRSLLDSTLVVQLPRVLKNLENAIRSGLSERRVDLLVSTLGSTAEGVLAVGDDGRVLMTNRRFSELWRIPPELVDSGDDDRLLAFVLDQLVEPEAFLAGVRRLYASDETSSDLLHFKDGRVFHRTSKALVREGKGRVWSFADVTAQYEARAALEAERNVFMDGPIGVLVWRRAESTWVLDYASANIGSILGYAAAQLLAGAPECSDCVHDHDRTRVAQELKTNLAASARRSWTQAYRVVWPDRTVRSLSDFRVVERDGAGRTVRMRAYLTDETQAHETARTLALTSERLQYALQGSNDGLWDWNLENNQVYYSPRWMEMLGFGVDELPPTLETWRSLVHPDDQQRTLALVNDYVEGRVQRFEVDFRMRHKKGHYLSILSRARLASTADGRPLSPRRLVGTHLDVTAQRQAENSLREAMRNAEGANQAKTQFLATMSHEIRTPLNGVLGMAQLLMLPDLGTGERQEYARTILSSGQTLLSLLNDILDLSKIEAGKLELMPVVFEMGQLLEEVTTLMSENAASKGLALVRRWAGAPGRHFRGDAIRLRQMLGNLVSNGIKFTDRGTVSVEVSEVGRDGPAGRVRFVVSDTGIGISKDKMERLFQPFSQLDGSETRRHGGTGLGLSIVRTLAELMGGSVGASSEAGRGSTFWFEVPLEFVTSTVGRAAENSAVHAMPGLGATGPNSARVLVAEDNSINRMVVQRMLEKMGFSVVCAEDGAQACELFRGCEPAFDVVLMDQQMPGMDGLEATRHIRAEEAGRGRRVPIIALTANTYDGDREACTAAGMDDFLSKPVNANQLLSTLRSWLAKTMDKSA